MKLSKNTRHYRRFEYWRDHTAAGRPHRDREEIMWDDRGYAVYDDNGPAYKSVPGRPISLCKYFWVVALRAPARMAEGWLRDRPTLTFGLSVLLVIVSLLVIGTLAPVSWWTPLALVAAIIGIMVGGFALVGAGFWLSDWNRERRRTTNKPSIVTAARQSLAAEFVKSKKRKVCPLIEFEE